MPFTLGAFELARLLARRLVEVLERLPRVVLLAVASPLDEVLRAPMAFARVEDVFDDVVLIVSDHLLRRARERLELAHVKLVETPPG